MRAMVSSMPGRSPFRAVALALSVLAWASCSSSGPPPLPPDIDQQCKPQTGCQDGLLCVRVFAEEVAADGGVDAGYEQAMNYTCHPTCMTDASCPTGYRCFKTQVDAMLQVCVLASVLANADGG